MEKATFGAGCFWGVESIFRQVRGVQDAVCGYCGGHKENPTYEEVYTDTTGHAEVVEVTFDPAIVTYEELLSAFFHNHNPTQLNCQGEDVGTRYRSVIFFHTPEQEKAAHARKAALAQDGKFDGVIVTAIEPVSRFWRAEEYHQCYFEKNGLPVCHPFIPGTDLQKDIAKTEDAGS